MRRINVTLIRFLALSALLSTNNAAFAQSLKGIVTDAQTQELLLGATIVVKEQPHLATISGLDGSFSLRNAGTYPLTLVCNYLGYQSTQIPVLNAKEAENLAISLAPANLEVAEVTIYAGNTQNTDLAVRNMERNAATILNIISAKAIEISPDMTVANVIQRVSGVSIERNNSGDGQYAILRGMDKRYNYTLVNGIKIPSPDNKNRFIPL
ncbi:MAG: TonB-dependent receptor, partial [Tannerellaceae bacterium]|nr:TonB-dependent receptor [Tannerellaceae bacterium]